MTYPWDMGSWGSGIDYDWIGNWNGAGISDGAGAYDWSGMIDDLLVKSETMIDLIGKYRGSMLKQREDYSYYGHILMQPTVIVIIVAGVFITMAVFRR